MTPTMLRVADVAARFGLSRKHVYAMITRGELEARYFGKAIRVPLAAVEAIERCQERTEDRAASMLRSTQASSDSTWRDSPQANGRATEIANALRAFRARK